MTTAAKYLDDGRELLRSQLESTNYPFQNIEIVERERDMIELVATLVGSPADPHELDGIVSRIEQAPIIQSASWNLRTAD